LGVSTKQSPYSGSIVVLGYVVDAWEGEPHADTDAMDLRFFRPDERPDLPFMVHRELLEIYDALR
jgi:hypothetical protein